MSLSAVVGVLGALGALGGLGGLTALLTVRGQSAKLTAEAHSASQAFYAAALSGQNAHIDTLEKRLNGVVLRVDELQRALTETEMLRRRAEIALGDVWEWVDMGAIPPPPERPPWMIGAQSAVTPTENLD